jgi:hypothetical protein
MEETLLHKLHGSVVNSWPLRPGPPRLFIINLLSNYYQFFFADGHITLAAGRRRPLRGPELRLELKREDPGQKFYA